MQCAGPLPLQDVTGMAVEMLEGLAQLHAAHILHLDLKPGNVLLDQYNHAYLSDFGISHALTTLEACTPTTGFSGTPHYMYASKPLLVQLARICHQQADPPYVSSASCCLTATIPSCLWAQRLLL